MRLMLLVLALISTIALTAQTPKKEVLLIGTFHFNNPGADVAQVNTFDVMSKQAQQELEMITRKIAAFRPDKVFVEWDYQDQARLDTLYRLYTEQRYFDYVATRYPKRSFYQQNEIFQLAFRVANASRHSRVYGIDYSGTKFPIDSLMASIDAAKQQSLKEEIMATVKQYEERTNKDRATLPLSQLILKQNETAYRNWDMGSYISLFNQGGSTDNFAGAYLVSEWYRRNLYMYALVQKLTESKDQRVMVLLGSSHVAMFKSFIDLDKRFKAVELKEVLR